MSQANFKFFYHQNIVMNTSFDVTIQRQFHPEQKRDRSKVMKIKSRDDVRLLK